MEFSLPKMLEQRAKGTLDYYDEIYLNEVKEVVNRRKANAILRQNRIANQYIKGVELGKFPYKNSR